MITRIQPKYIALIILILILASYTLFQARFLILGPNIIITSPENGEVVTDEVLTIRGSAKNISWISLNDRQIFTDDRGSWSEKLIVSKGTSIITVKARDRFGRETRESIQIILN